MTRKIAAMVPLRIDQRPKLKGPYLNVWRDDVTLRMIGMEYDIEYPIVEI